jgi:hypothetical protein
VARKITSGLVGGTEVGGISFASSSFFAGSDNNISIATQGTGNLILNTDTVITENVLLQSQSDIRLSDADSSNWLALQAPASVTSNVTWTLPSTDSAVNGHALISNSAGTLSWGLAGATITDESSDSGTNYPVFSSTATPGNITSTRAASSRMSFVPSTGTLSVSAINVNGIAKILWTEVLRTANHTIELSDRNRVMNMSGTGLTLTIPTNTTTAFPIGSVVKMYVGGPGTVVIGGAGVTINYSSATLTYAVGKEVYIRKRGTNEWTVSTFAF